MSYIITLAIVVTFYLGPFRSLSLTKNTTISMSHKNYLNPRLPMDIERMIFELAVSEHGAKASTPLMLVAKRVREW